MPGDLILSSLEIQRFRCFRELRIERLGRVNLIVGKNNVGKSTILEALRLFANPSSPSVLLEILASRNEISRADIDAWGRNPGSPISLDSLFFGRQGPAGRDISIGPTDSPDKSLEVAIKEESQEWNFSYPEEARITGKPSTVLKAYHRYRFLVFRLGFSTQVFPVGVQNFQGLPANPGVAGKAFPPGESFTAPIRELPHFSVKPEGLDLSLIGQLWDGVSLSPLENDVVAALHIISPGIERVAMKASRSDADSIIPAGVVARRVPFVKHETFEEPIPLRALGDGVNRQFGLALALVSAKGGLLLVDEIENGIHYSVQADLWRLIFETAARLNVQVFATTHSYDCIKAFEEAARESEEEGILIRLARRDDKTLVGEFDEPELEIAVEGDIEVR